MENSANKYLNDIDNPHVGYYSPARGFTEVEQIFEIINHRGYIAGSYAAYMANCNVDPMQPGDIDIFATSAERAKQIHADLVAALYPTIASYGETDVAYTINRSARKDPLLPIQIVKPDPRWINFPKDILNSFDFDICRAILIEPTIIIADHNIGSGNGKILLINNPIRELKRVLKYHKRGVEFDDWELVKLFKAWDATSAERKATLLAQVSEPKDDNLSEYSSGGYSEDDYFDGE